MLSPAISAFALLAGAPSVRLPEFADAPFLDYFAKAVQAERREPQKALAMLEVLVISTPLDVIADYSGVPENLRDEYADAVADAFGMWERSLGSDFPLRLVRKSNSAIRLTFASSIRGGEPNQKGEFYVTRRIQWGDAFHSGEIDGHFTIVKLATKDRYMTGKEIKHIVAHEVGHSLGLADSESLERIMGPVMLGNPFARVTSDEVRQVKEIRAAIKKEISFVLDAVKTRK
jgi:predicted Zn-dependent protease